MKRYLIAKTRIRVTEKTLWGLLERLVCISYVYDFSDPRRSQLDTAMRILRGSGLTNHRRDIDSTGVSWLAIFAISLGVTISRHSRVLYVPEEAPMLNYSISLNCLQTNNHTFWNSFSCPEQLSLFMPWGLLSAFLELLGVGIVGEFQIIFFLRLFLFVGLSFLLFQEVSHSRLISLACAVLPLGIPYVMEAMYYGHQWSNLILISGLTWALTTTFRSEQIMRTSMFGVLSLALSVFQNLAHLISAWLSIPFALWMCYSRFGRVQTLHRLKNLLILAAIIYAAPIIVYSIRISFWTPLDLTNLQIMRSGGVIQLIQGFGSWWQDAKFLTSTGYELPYRYLGLHSSLLRQTIRLLLFGLAVSAPFLLRTISINSAVRRRKNLDAWILLYSLCLSLILSGIGGSRYFPSLWMALPEYLKIFREPWQKFIPIYIVVLHSLAALSITALLQKIHRSTLRHLFVLTLLAISFYQVLPSLKPLQSSHPDQILLSSGSVEYWRQLSSDIDILETVVQRHPRCIQSTDSSVPANALLELRLGRFLSDTPRLRTLSINDALRELGVAYNQCAIYKGKPYLVEFLVDTARSKYVVLPRSLYLTKTCGVLELETLRLVTQCGR